MKTNLISKLMFVTAIPFLLNGCIAKKIETIKANYSTIPDSPKELDIPIYESPHYFAGLPYNYWHYAKQKERQLGIPKLEISGIEQVFRVWITNPVGTVNQPHGLIRIVCDSGSCSGELIFMRVNFDKRVLKEEIVELNREDLSSTNMTMKEVADSLILLKFDKLPTDQQIPNYYENEGGYLNNTTTFSFEYSTPQEYRFYQYNDLYRTNEEFWQVQNVLKIFELLESEFQWDTRARQFFFK